MANKITLNKEEEIELTEREQQIYDQGLEDGDNGNSNLFVFFIWMQGILLGLLVSKLFSS